MNKRLYLLVVNVFVILFSVFHILGSTYIPTFWSNMYLGISVVFLICAFTVFYYYYFLFFYGQNSRKFASINGFLFFILYIIISFISLLFFSIESFVGGRSACEDTKSMKYCFDPNWIERNIRLILIVVIYFTFVCFIFIKTPVLTKKYMKK